MTSQTDFDGNVTDYSYNSLGQLSTKTVYASSNLGTPYETVTYAYNVNYNAQGDYYDTVTDSLGGTTDTEYDANGHVIAITTTSPQSSAIAYNYDPATGSEIEESTANTDIHYAYDAAGELTSVTVTRLDGQPLSAPLVTTYAYDLDGNLISTQNANGTTETRTYDKLNRVTSIVDTGPSGTIASFAYTYDLAGHQISETDLSGRTDVYIYDNLYRLTEENISDPALGTRTVTYTYDLVGNQLTKSDSGRSVNQQLMTFVYDKNDRLTSVTGSSGYGQTFTYDANGNTLTVTGSGVAISATYTWDPRGRLIEYVSGGSTTTYSYSDSDDRTSETTNGQTTVFLNDPNSAFDQVLEEYATGGVLAATYIRGLDLLFQDRSKVQTYYITDSLGSTRGLTNSLGALTDAYLYDAFGNVLVHTGSTVNEFMFAGQQFDAALQQYYLRARYYSPQDGRFISRDSRRARPATR